jgi:hypothetical protein
MVGGDRAKSLAPIAPKVLSNAEQNLDIGIAIYDI